MRPREMYHYDGKTDLSKMRDDAIKLSKGGYASRATQETSKQEVLIHLHGHDATCFLHQENVLDGQEHEYYKDGKRAWKTDGTPPTKNASDSPSTLTSTLTRTSKI